MQPVVPYSHRIGEGGEVGSARVKLDADVGLLRWRRPVCPF